MSNNLKDLKRIHSYLKLNLSTLDLQEISNKCHTINVLFKGNDGSGLTGGCLIEMLITKYFEMKFDNYKTYHKGESDMEICNLKLSLKKITGNSTIALSWSKNKTIKCDEEFFVNNIFLINLKTERWWKKAPLKMKGNLNYTHVIKSGIYLLDKDFCKKRVTLISNNKTDTMVSNVFLYELLQNCLENDLFIEFPNPSTTLEFNILDAFSK